MAVLLGGESYALSSSNHQKKTIVYLKLTDSSLRALEEYISNSQQHQNNSAHRHFKPTIEFNQNSGKICIPRNNNGDKSTYRFNVSSINESTGPQGSFECLQSHKPSSTLESIGSLQEKITVNASDDAYKRFGQKMVEVKKENEKRTTQFLDNNKVSNKISSKLRHKNHHSSSSSSHNNNPLSSSSSSTSLSTTSSSSSVSNKNNISSSISLSRHLNNSSNLSSSSNSNNNSVVVSGSSHSSLSHRISAAGAGPPRSASPSLAPNHPIMDRKQAAASSFTKSVNPPGHPNISRRPLKERIIHHLAVGPLKKLELNSRLHRDGLRDKDKKLIGSVIKQVSLMKDNTYSLLRHLWNDVSEDWPYYTEQEKATFRRRKPQNLTPPVSDGGSSTCSSGHSPSSTNPASPARCERSPPHHPANKRSFPYDSDLNSKKKRVSNYSRPPPGPSSSSSGGPPPRVAVPTARKMPSSSSTSSPPPTVEDPSTKTSNWLRGKQQAPSSQQPNNPAGGSAAFPRDFLTSFVKIKDKGQRATYKVEFNNNYIRYRELHSQLEKVSKRFAQSEEQLRSVIRSEEKGEARKKIKEIEQDYRNTNNDPAYIRTREEFKYLHEKLAHIKGLVHEYDMDNLSKGGKGGGNSSSSGGARGLSPVLSAMS